MKPPELCRDRPLRVLLAGASGRIGRATAQALLARGHAVEGPLRSGAVAPVGMQTWSADLDHPAWPCLGPRRYDAVVSCLASRSGLPDDAWAVDDAATRRLIEAARGAGARQVVLLSALCVQKPRLAFQHAKRAAEAAAMRSGLSWSIVRPTAFFASLSGQVARVKAGRPFLVLGNGRRTACKPISDADVAEYLVGCLHEPLRWNRILPIGGPGPALTPADQAALLADLLGRPVPLRRAPPLLLKGVAAGLGLAARWHAGLSAKAELARIGGYYATESMLVWDGWRYREDLTPETGRDTLRAHYARLLRGEAQHELGAHAVF